MALNLSGVTPIPQISVDVPSDAVSVYNMLVNQINVAMVAGSVATGPAFTDQVVGALTAANVTAQILILVELRCISNMLYEGPAVTGDLNVMRAEELYTVISTPPTM